MRLRVTILCWLVVQTSAFSYFEEYYTRAYTTVDNNFNRLVSDVVADVQVTIDCTLLGVKKALSLGGMFDEFDHSEYDRRCKEQTEKINPVTDVQPISYTSTLPLILDDSRITTEGHANLKKDLSQDIEDSITNAGKTVDEYLKRKPYHRISYGKNQYSPGRLYQVNTLLTTELDKIRNENTDVKSYNIDRTKPIVENFKEEIKILQDIEQKQKDPEAKEIRQVFDDVLNVFNNNNTSSLSTNQKIKTIIDDIELESSNQTLTAIENQFTSRKEDTKLNETALSPSGIPNIDLKLEEINTSNNDVADQVLEKFAGLKDMENKRSYSTLDKTEQQNELDDIVDALGKSSNETINKLETKFSQFKEDVKENIQNQEEVQHIPEVDDIIEDLEKSSDDTMTDIKEEISEWEEVEKKYIDEIKESVESDENNPSIEHDEKITEIIENIEKKSSETISNIENKFSQLSEHEHEEFSHIAEETTMQTEISGVDFQNKQTSDEENDENKLDESNKIVSKEIKESVVKDNEIIATLGEKQKEVTEDEIANNFRAYFDRLFAKQENEESDKNVGIDLTLTDSKTASVFNDYFSGTNNKIDNTQAVKDAERVIKESCESSAAIDKLFSKSESQKSAMSVFDSPDLLNF